MGRTVIVVPCFNEERRFRPDAFLRFCRERGDVDFLLVDDGSTDRTGEVLESTASAMPDRIGALRLTPNGGKAEAVRRGLVHALRSGPDHVGFWDADLATPLEAIPGFVDVLESRPEIDMVLGSRVKLLGRAIERRAVRHYLGRVFATGASWVLGLPVYDTQCGAKLFRVRPELEPMLADRFLTRWIFDVELIARALAADRSAGRDAAAGIVEFPLLEWRDVAGSKVRPFDFVKAAWELMRIAIRYRR